MQVSLLFLFSFRLFSSDVLPAGFTYLVFGRLLYGKAWRNYCWDLLFFCKKWLLLIFPRNHHASNFIPHTILSGCMNYNSKADLSFFCFGGFSVLSFIYLHFCTGCYRQYRARKFLKHKIGWALNSSIVLLLCDVIASSATINLSIWNTLHWISCEIILNKKKSQEKVHFKWSKTSSSSPLGWW